MGSPAKKAHFTNELFAEVAPVYNRFILGPMSFFRDAAWKEWLIENIPPLPPGPAIDLATGTGLIAYRLAEKHPTREIIGLDINAEMLAIARGNNPFDNVSFDRINMDDLNHPTSSIALFTGGYALRNSPDLEKLLRAIATQLKPGGVAAFLDFSRPANQFGTRIVIALLRVWTGAWSLLMHRNLRIYSYIPQSLATFPDRALLRKHFREVGLTPLLNKSFLFGIVEANIVQKEVL